MRIAAGQKRHLPVDSDDSDGEELEVTDTRRYGGAAAAAAAAAAGTATSTMAAAAPRDVGSPPGFGSAFLGPTVADAAAQHPLGRSAGAPAGGPARKRPRVPAAGVDLQPAAANLKRQLAPLKQRQGLVPDGEVLYLRVCEETPKSKPRDVPKPATMIVQGYLAVAAFRQHVPGTVMVVYRGCTPDSAAGRAPHGKLDMWTDENGGMLQYLSARWIRHEEAWAASAQDAGVTPDPDVLWVQDERSRFMRPPGHSEIPWVLKVGETPAEYLFDEAAVLATRAAAVLNRPVVRSNPDALRWAVQVLLHLERHLERVPPGSAPWLAASVGTQESLHHKIVEMRDRWKALTDFDMKWWLPSKALMVAAVLQEAPELWDGIRMHLDEKTGEVMLTISDELVQRCVTYCATNHPHSDVSDFVRGAHPKIARLNGAGQKRYVARGVESLITTIRDDLSEFDRSGGLLTEFDAGTSAVFKLFLGQSRRRTEAKAIAGAVRTAGSDRLVWLRKCALPAFPAPTEIRLKNRPMHPHNEVMFPVGDAMSNMVAVAVPGGALLSRESQAAAKGFDHTVPPGSASSPRAPLIDCEYDAATSRVLRVSPEVTAARQAFAEAALLAVDGGEGFRQVLHPAVEALAKESEDVTFLHELMRLVVDSNLAWEEAAELLTPILRSLNQAYEHHPEYGFALPGALIKRLCGLRDDTHSYQPMMARLRTLVEPATGHCRRLICAAVADIMEPAPAELADFQAVIGPGPGEQEGKRERRVRQKWSLQRARDLTVPAGVPPAPSVPPTGSSNPVAEDSVAEDSAPERGAPARDDESGAGVMSMAELESLVG